MSIIQEKIFSFYGSGGPERAWALIDQSKNFPKVAKITLSLNFTFLPW